MKRKARKFKRKLEDAFKETALLTILHCCAMAIDAGLSRDAAIKAVVVSYRVINQRRTRLAARRRKRG